MRTVRQLVAVVGVGCVLAVAGAYADPIAEPVAAGEIVTGEVWEDGSAPIAGEESARVEAECDAPAPGISPDLTVPEWQWTSCSSDCTDQYFVCMDDCDAWPYPGCAQDCRNALNACRMACIGGG